MKRTLAWCWLAVALLAAAYVGWRADTGIKFRSDVLALLPPDSADRARAADNQIVTAALSRRVVFMLGDTDTTAAQQAAQQLNASLLQAGLIQPTPATPSLNALQSVAASYAPYRDGLLSPEDRTLLATGQRDRLVSRVQARLFGVGSPIGGEQLRHDPLLLFTDFLSNLPRPRSQWQSSLSVQSRGRSWVVLQATLAGDPYAVDFGNRVVAAVDQFTARQAHPQFALLRTGAVFFAQAGAKTGLDESSRLATISIIGTLLLALLAFRSLWPISLTILAMAVGMLVALAGSLALFGEPHISALVFGGSLIGVVVDYSVQYATEVFSTRFEPPARRLRQVLPSITIGAATTMAGYLTLLMAPFPGLRQIAVFSALGLFASWTTVVLWFPLIDRSSPAKHGASWLRWCARWIALFETGPHRRSILLALVLAALTIAGWSRLKPDDDIRHMQELSPALIQQEERITEIAGVDAQQRFLVVAAPNDEAALETEEQAAQRLQPLLGKALTSFQSLAQYVPSAARQTENRALIAAQLPSSYLATATAQIGVHPAPTQPNAAVLRPATLLAGPLSALRALEAEDGAGHAIQLITLSGVTDTSAIKASLAGLDSVWLVDTAHDFSDLLGRYRRRALALLLVSVALVSAMIMARYGPRRGAIVMLPPLAAVFLAPALRALLGGDYTFFDAIAQIMILSVGVDYAVFCAETGGTRRPVTMLAVIIAAAAAFLSFGLLAFSAAQAVRGFGLTMGIGIVLSVMLAPAARLGMSHTPPEGHWADLTERGTAWGLHFVAACHRIFGRAVCRLVLVPITLFFYLAQPARRRFIHSYIKRLNAHAGLRLSVWPDGYRIYLNFALRSLDNFAALARPDQIGNIRIEGQQHFEATRGGLLIVSHHGNVELSRGALASRSGATINVLLHTKQAARYNALLRGVRRDYLAHTIEVTEIGPGTAIALAERIERGEWIAIAGDRVPVSNTSRTSRVPFLGADARFSQGPYIIAGLLGCPVLLLSCERETDGHVLRFEPFAARIQLPRGPKDAFLAALATDYARHLETRCIAAPLQWYNFFDFWAAE